MAAIRNKNTGGARKRIAGETAKGATPKKKGSAPKPKLFTRDKLPNGKRNNYNPKTAPTPSEPTPTKAQRPNTVMVSKNAVKTPPKKWSK
jgi:hypothetical protein